MKSIGSIIFFAKSEESEIGKENKSKWAEILNTANSGEAMQRELQLGKSWRSVTLGE